ncbi:hypothetical protein [Catalinimonas niigatensis]|uniref:hypothetical protein n=1 Tax=Catalinimonas niigatensis TaxID=1397264 RepID=UPI002665F766|nr:hypothetical protein [Catalinimonas niigatensis]WPP53236.1 hypothetical protein PZB72_12725 [Catalinimonas niigatensis]
MIIEEFKKLSRYEQVNFLQYKGVFLTVLKTKHYIFKLYAIDKFYVELLYDTSLGTVDINVLSSTNKLDYYLQEIKVEI